MVDAASEILCYHVADAFGFCGGCAEQWQRIIPHNACNAYTWAASIWGELDLISGDRPRWIERGAAS